jgi:hypothetical protein
VSILFQYRVMHPFIVSCCRIVANAAIGWLTILIATVRDGASVQQRLSAIGISRVLFLRFRGGG